MLASASLMKGPFLLCNWQNTAPHARPGTANENSVSKMTLRSQPLAVLSQLRTGLLWVAAATIVVTVIFGDLPGEGKYAGVLQDSCHAPAFAALSIIALTLLARWAGRPAAAQPASAPTARTLLMQAATVVLAMLLVGVLTECVQGLLGRDAELADVESDVVGSLGATGLWAYLQLRTSRDDATRAGRVIAVLVCIATFGYWVYPLLKCADAYWHRTALLPVLAQFQSQRDLYFLDCGGSKARIVATPGAGGGAADTALEVDLDRGRWPGITLFEPAPDWRHYHTLAMDLSNPGPNPLPLRVRVNDHAHNAEFDDRFNDSLLLAPGTRTTLRISLQEIAASPRTRRMDMNRVAAIILFHDGSAPGEVLRLHRIWLE
jgi:hypothetical protein